MLNLSNPSKELWAAQVADPGDAAFDRAHPDFDERVTAYMRSRTLEDLAKIPLLPGAKLTLWRLRPLTSPERTDLRGLGSDALRWYFACRTAVTARMDNAEIRDGNVFGTLVESPVDRSGNMPLAPTRWCDEQHELAGGQWSDEFGDLVMRRASVSPKAQRPPFVLTWPLALATSRSAG